MLFVMKNPIFQGKNIHSLLQGRIPGQLVIQYTNACNATCPQCSMRKSMIYARSKISEEEIYKIIDSAEKQKIQALSFTGGEPFLYKEELLRLLNYASKRDIPYLRTGTNGFLFMNSQSSDFTDRMHRLAQELSKTRLRNLWISIDSADAKTHEQMRGLPDVIRGIEKALPIFHQYGIYPAANLGINRNTGGMGSLPEQMTEAEEFYAAARASFQAFYQFVINLGFTMVNACYPMSMEQEEEGGMQAVYGATSANPVIKFTREEKIQLFQALMDTIPEYRSRIKIFTPLVSLYSLIRQYQGEESFSLPCRGGIDFFFIDAADGNTYPCGYRGNENMGKFYQMEADSLKLKPFCKACDWECFRDPSELLGYLIHTVRNPFRLITDNRDSAYKALWKKDIRYYINCNFFDGRK
jgi:MoaA/NifB/PqqE/SkfB family radical SAM enzyme